MSLPTSPVKYAGGKRKMIPHIFKYIPSIFGDYHEPFCGGASVYWELAKRRMINQIQYSKAYLSDDSEELINLYKIIQSDAFEIFCGGLKVAQELSESQSEDERKEEYLEWRKIDVSDLNNIERAVRFVYLNKNCFNGLYRVNKNGGFNVPFGKYKNPKIYDEPNLKALHGVLSKDDVSVVCESFECMKRAKPGDLVYLDPPYLPLSKTANFTGYTKKRFGLEEHKELAKIFRESASNGVHLILSNSSAEEIYSLYDGFEIIELSGDRCVGGPVEYRSPVTELMIVANVTDCTLKNVQSA